MNNYCCEKRLEGYCRLCQDAGEKGVRFRITCGLMKIPDCQFKDKPFTFPEIAHAPRLAISPLVVQPKEFVSSSHSPSEVIFNDQIYDYIEFNANGHWQYNRRDPDGNVPVSIEYDDSDRQWYDDSMSPVSGVIYSSL